MMSTHSRQTLCRTKWSLLLLLFVHQLLIFPLKFSVHLCAARRLVALPFRRLEWVGNRLGLGLTISLALLLFLALSPIIQCPIISIFTRTCQSWP